MRKVLLLLLLISRCVYVFGYPIQGDESSSKSLLGLGFLWGLFEITHHHHHDNGGEDNNNNDNNNVAGDKGGSEDDTNSEDGNDSNDSSKDYIIGIIAGSIVFGMGLILIYCIYRESIVKFFKGPGEPRAQDYDETGLNLTWKCKIKRFLHYVCISLPLIPFLPLILLILFFKGIKYIIFGIKERRRRNRLWQDYQNTDLDYEFKNPRTHKFDTVTRYEVKNFKADINSNLLKDFNYMDPENSFTKKIIFNTEVQSTTTSNNTTNESSENTTQSDEEIDGETGCAICLERFKYQDQLLLFPCKHQFHESCLSNYRDISIANGSSSDENLNFRCLLCNLNMSRQYLYYKSYKLDPEKIPFENKMNTKREPPVIEKFKLSKKFSLFKTKLQKIWKK